MTSPRAPLKLLLNQGDDTLGGGEQATMDAPTYDVASSCLVCGVEFFDVGHRTSRRGVELFDEASNSSTWHRTFRRGVEMFDVGHRNVAGECPLTSNIPTFPHSHIVAYVREAIRAALQSSSAATAKSCLGWLHLFAGDVESQAHWHQLRRE